MPTRLATPATALLLALLSWQAAAAGGNKPENPYKLKLQNAGDYRLHGSMATSASVPVELAAKPYAREIEKAARANGLDPVLVHALIHVESGHRQDAISNKGAVGLMQVLPATAERFGISEPDKVGNNLKAGTRYLRALLDRFNQRLDLALAAYNAGEGVVERYQGIPPYTETQAYVPAVLQNYSHWRSAPQLRHVDGMQIKVKPVSGSST